MDVLSNMAMENHNLSLGDASWSIGPHFSRCYVSQGCLFVQEATWNLQAEAPGHFHVHTIRMKTI